MRWQLRPRRVERTYQPDTSNYGLENFCCFTGVMWPLSYVSNLLGFYINFYCFSLSRRPSKANFYVEIAARRRCTPNWLPTIPMSDGLRVLQVFLCSIIGKLKGLGDLINPAKFCADRFNRFWSAGGWISRPPILVCYGQGLCSCGPGGVL
jgi:hypothetical protein